MLQYAPRVEKSALVIYGEMDDEALPEGVKQLYEKLATNDKTLRSFAEADHYLYDTAFIKMTPSYDPVKAEEVVGTVREWLKAH
jgi:dienelactone hydrolase